MANYWTDVWTDIITVMKDGWSDVGVSGHPIFRAPQVERVNWVNVIRSSQMTAPWAVVQMMADQEEGWGITWTAFRLTIVCTYIAKHSGTDMAATLEAKVKSLQDKVQSPTTPYTHLRVLDTGFSVDVTENNPITRAMLDSNYPFSAASLKFQALAGEY